MLTALVLAASTCALHVGRAAPHHAQSQASVSMDAKWEPTRRPYTPDWLRGSSNIYREQQSEYAAYEQQQQQAEAEAPRAGQEELPAAAIIVRSGSEAVLGAQLATTLAAAGMKAVNVGTVEQALATANVRAVFELSVDGSSMDLMEVCSERGADLYRWQGSVGMFKRLCGSGGPAWLSSGANSAVSEDIVTEERGWGYLSGDEEQVVDTSNLTDAELATLLNLPQPQQQHDSTGGKAADDWPAPLISALGYSLQAVSADELAAAAPLTPTARRVLLHKATEAPGTASLADGAHLPPLGTRGTFVSALSGAPLFTSSQRLTSSTGWPSFAAQPSSAAAQHLASATDISGGVVRDECVEAASGAHLGHAFDNVLCINAAAILFVPQAERPPSWVPRPAAPAIDAVLAERPQLLGEAHVATLGGGCFWSMRRALAGLPGVHCALAGFCGGATPCPSYADVCTGESGHVEAVQLAFDPRVLTYTALLEAYWRALPDPTSRYRQGADVGAQYEPCVFYHSEEQRADALRARAALQERLGSDVATRLRHATAFYVADAEHQR